MKNLFYFIGGASVVLLLSAGYPDGITFKKSHAEAEQYQGIYIFTDSRPVLEANYLGTVKVSVGLTSSGQYTSVRDLLIKKAKKEYPAAEAIILNFKDGGTDRADVVSFK